MLLHEIANPNYAIRNLLKDLNFTTTRQENSEIEKRLEKKRIKPTLNNMKRYLLRCFLTPVEELPQPERRIISDWQHQTDTNNKDKYWKQPVLEGQCY